ncbi:HEAT repeat domain-containing protein [Colwellia sp. MT41]|uniref:HEAT repeat domain-containing protein n=1 Tax=Colwellia sp. MT41 TaxID=58049 RepID=UPI0009F8FCA6|nr:HEAT repeat domain-containing protein [Colwellia sp. MT41]
MIFSSFFKTKANWQHKDTTVRITAINSELSVDNSEQLAILTDLIQQDSSDLVRRAALIKVASFDCYLDASHNNSQAKVKQFAGKQVHDILATDHKIVLCAEMKQNILAKQAQNPILGTVLLEAWLAHEQDSAIMIALYQQISARKTSTHLLSHSFSQKQNPEFQTYLLSQVDDSKVLEKLSKKVCNDTLAQQVNHKLAAIQAAVEKPKKLAKTIQLVLAKLQALKDVADYGEYKKRKSRLIDEWQVLEPEHEVFSAEERSIFNDKYQGIINHLEKLFIAKAESYQQQIIIDKLAHDKQRDKKDFTQQLNHISQAITTAVFSSDNLDEEQFLGSLGQLNTAIEASALNKDEQQVFILQVKQLTKRLGQIPEIAESVSQATNLISKISQLTLPTSLQELNSRQETYHDWLKTWRLIEQKTAGILPESIVQAQKQIVSTWQGGLKPLQSQQKELFFVHKKKLQDIKRLLNNGKFKVCFGLFKGVKENIDQLSAQQKQQLQRDFDQVSEKMTELSDWEHYIATPRKQELLLAVQALVDTPLDNPNEQAEKVKAYRSTWNSLGHADEDIDKQLNEQFNQRCEQAFAPCRLFYAEQDKIRQQHLEQRNNILAQVEQLVTELNKAEETQSVDFKKLDGKLNTIQQHWKNAGEVDRNQYKKLQQQFKNTIAPVKSAIGAFHLTNSKEKQALIVKAQQLIASDDIFAAIDSAKQLQQSWREVGFAGNHQESQLWQKFRQVNDELFAKRQVLKSEQQAALSNQQQAYDEKVSTIAESLISFTNQAANKEVEPENKQTLQDIEQQAEALLTEVIANKPVIKVAVARLEKIIKQVEQLIKSNRQVKEQQRWLNLFELMSLQAQSNQDVEALTASAMVNKLSSFWQKRWQEHVKLSEQVQGGHRLDKTLEIEILGKSESPAELADQRMKVQVQLMQEQMLSGIDIDLSKLLVDWLMLGTLTEGDLPLIRRLKAIYCQ